MPRPALNKAFAVGLLVAVAGLSFLVAYTFFKKGGYGERDSYRVHAFFEDATGLTWKSRVQIAGIVVGEVEQVTLAGDRARLDLRIKKEIDVHADACLVKRFPSALLPDALLELTTGSQSKPSLRSLPEEKREITCVREAASVAKLLDSLAKVTADVQVITRELAQTVAAPEGSIKEIIQHLSTVARNIDQTVSENGHKLGAILDNAEAFTATLREVAETDQARYHAIARNVEQASAQLTSVLSTLQSILGANQQDLGASVAGLKQSLEKMNHSLDQIDKVVTNIGQGKGVAGKLLADERLGEKLGTALEGASDYVNRLVQLQVKLELRSEWLLNQTGSKTYFGIKILPRPDKYYLIEIVSDPRGVNTVTNETVDTRDMVTGARTSTQTTRTVNQQQLSFSAEFAKRYGFATFRIGVIESSGGIGTDLHLMNDRLQISVNLYQFTRPTQDVFPRAKIWANYSFLDHFYLTAGADDFLNAWRAGKFPGGPKFSIGRDVFFGAGLFFTDDDLKTLLGAGVGSTASAAATTTK